MRKGSSFCVKGVSRGMRRGYVEIPLEVKTSFSGAETLRNHRKVVVNHFVGVVGGLWKPGSAPEARKQLKTVFEVCVEDASRVRKGVELHPLRIQSVSPLMSV